MTQNDDVNVRLLGSLRSANGKGVVRMEERFDADIDDVWSALTDPQRLASWFAVVEGDPRLGGEYRQRVLASGWVGTVRVEAYEPPLRLRTSQIPDGPDVPVTGVEVTLSVEDEQTVLVIESRGMPVDLLFAYGAGWQIHVEDLADHLAGREHRDASARWDELEAVYQKQAVRVR